MKKTRVDIWKDDFNGEYYADVGIDTRIEYISSDNLFILLEMIKQTILEWNN